MMLISFTTANEEEAVKIVDILLKEKLIACANMFPVKSAYWWKNKTKRSDECMVLCKSNGKLFKKIVKRIRELHSYELPVIERIDVKTYPAVDKWIKGSMK